MVTWVDYLEKVRRTTVSFNADTIATADAMLDCANYAFNDLCMHTAYISEMSLTHGVSIDPDNSPNPYDLSTVLQYRLVPEAYFDPIEAYATAAVYVDGDIVSQDDYEFTRSGHLLFGTAPGGSLLEIDYYAFYPEVLGDADVLTIPRWAEGISKFRILSHLTTLVATQAADIAQYKGSRDSGNPEHNPLEELQKHAETMYRQLLNYVPRQDRHAPLWKTE